LLAEHGEVYQYYGKWPFIRFLGMQEPAAVLFSIGNLVMHFQAFLNIRKRLVESSGPVSQLPLRARSMLALVELYAFGR
jgi:hypothetical protein